MCGVCVCVRKKGTVRGSQKRSNKLTVNRPKLWMELGQLSRDRYISVGRYNVSRRNPKIGISRRNI